MKAATGKVQIALLQAGVRTDVKDRDGRSVFQHFCHRTEALHTLLDWLPKKQVPLVFRLWHHFHHRQRRQFGEALPGKHRETAHGSPVVRGQSVGTPWQLGML